MKNAKCVVTVTNSNGEPDLLFVIVQCTEEQYENGDHYSRAKCEALERGFDPYLVYDEGSPGFGSFEWDETAPVIIV